MVCIVHHNYSVFSNELVHVYILAELPGIAWEKRQEHYPVKFW